MEGRLAAGVDELLRNAKAEGSALTERFRDPVGRVWASAEIAHWECRVAQLVHTMVPVACQALWRRSILDQQDPQRSPPPYLPGLEGWWAEHRLARRLADLDHLLEALAEVHQARP